MFENKKTVMVLRAACPFYSRLTSVCADMGLPGLEPV